MVKVKLRLGTRKSNLALAQARIVMDKIQAAFPDIEVEICKFTTTGDTLYDANLTLFGGKGLFVKEIEEALLSNQIDIAVHSMKDVPAYLPEGLSINAILEREAVNDAFISFKYNSLAELPQNAVVGSSSSRRALQIKALRPDLKIIPFRGNVNTRLTKLEEGQADAIVLALAGLKRLNLTSYVKQIFTIDEMLPAIAQGAIGVESKSSDVEVNKILSCLNHDPTFKTVSIEREFMIAVSGNCTTPMAGHAVLRADGLVDFKAGYCGEKQNNHMAYHEVIGMKCDDFGRIKKLSDCF